MSTCKVFRRTGETELDFESCARCRLLFGDQIHKGLFLPLHRYAPTVLACVHVDCLYEDGVIQETSEAVPVVAYVVE